MGTIYRHHSSVETFIDTFFQKTLQFITKSKKTCIFAGDFNVDLIKYGENKIVEDFYDELSSHGFRPLILQPTRVTSASLSLIDNIFTNDITSQSSGGNLTTSISDHFSQFSQIDILKNMHIKNKEKHGRNWRIFNSNEFREELIRCSWDDVISPTINTHISVSNFYHKIEKLLDEMAPVKKMTQKEIGLRERPWIDHDILVAMFERNKLHKDFLDERNSIIRNENYENYKTKRNLVTSQLRKAKKKYFNNFFEENQNNIKETWKGIRNLINVSKKSTTNINKLFENGKEITNPIDMADTINKLYVNIGKTVEEKIPQGNKTFSYYLRNRNSFNIVLNPCTTEEIK